jgi:hypothetical protein
MSAVVDWPTKKEHGRNPFFEDIAGTAETLKANAQRMFITTDAIDVEACIVRPSGMFSIQAKSRYPFLISQQDANPREYEASRSSRNICKRIWIYNWTYL